VDWRPGAWLGHPEIEDRTSMLVGQNRESEHWEGVALRLRQLRRRRLARRALAGALWAGAALIAVACFVALTAPQK
jgi:hypothetical protein